MICKGSYLLGTIFLALEEGTRKLKLTEASVGGLPALKYQESQSKR